MRHVLRAGTDGQPEHVFGTAEAGAQFVQLEVQLEGEPLVQSVRVYTCTSEPGGDGGLSVAEHTPGSGRIQPFGQRREQHCNVMGRGFQTVQGRVEPGAERSVAGMASKRLDALGRAMLAIADKGMDVGLGDAEIRALLVGTGETFRVYPLGAPRRLFISR
jgi:hypothetical protein